MGTKSEPNHEDVAMTLPGYFLSMPTYKDYFEQRIKEQYQITC